MTGTIVNRDVWLKERMALLRREKAVTRELDLLALERQKHPWVSIKKTYELELPEGKVTLEELFGSNHQLIIYHFMYGPQWKSPCDGCSAWAEAFNGTLGQLERHDAALVAVSRAPIDMINEVKKSRAWTFPWASSYNSAFNSDFHMSVPPDCESVMVGDEIIAYDRGESGGINVFVKTDDGICHTYSAHNRGIQQMNGTYGYIDLLPYGGN